MTWFKTDDGWGTHPKVQAAGLYGRALWYMAGNQCAKVDSDGLVDGRMVKMYASLAEVPAKKATDLVLESGLWHDSTLEGCTHPTRCQEHIDQRLGGLAPGNFFFHDWFDYQLLKDGKTDSIAREHELRKKRLLRNSALCAAIRRRDRDLCRYCGVHAVFQGDRKSKRSGTYDHIDPFGTNAMANVVVACKGCNEKKGMRTPEQANMPLLPEPAPYLTVVDVGPGLDLAGGRSDQARAGSGADPDAENLAGPRVTREVGTGVDPAGSDPAGGQVGPGGAGPGDGDGSEPDAAGGGSAA